MRKPPGAKSLKFKGISQKYLARETDNILHRLAFDNSLQANIITTVSSGKIINVNNAACKLLGYSKMEMLNKNKRAIFDITESNFKTMLKQMAVLGHAIALVTAIKSNGTPIPCEITSSVFKDARGSTKSITTITDLSHSILRQKKIDIEKDKLVAENIVIAQLEQKEIDAVKEKIVSGNIALAKSRQKKIDIEKDKSVAADIVLVQSEQKEIDAEKEKMIAGNIALAKSKQKNIDIRKDKLVADNILVAQAKSDARLAENNKWIKYIAKASYDVMWDWDITTGEIYVGDSIEEVFGYKLQDDTMTFTEFSHALSPDIKDKVEEKILVAIDSNKFTWDDSYLLRRQDGSIASVTSRASIIRDDKGKAIRMIGATQDVSSLEELEKKLALQITAERDHHQIFHLTAGLSYDAIWDWNIVTNEFYMSEGFEELFGYPMKNLTGNMTDWSKHLHPDDKEVVEESLQAAISSPASHWEQAYRFIKADESLASVLGRAIIIRNDDGKASRMVGAIHDFTRQQELEGKLELEIKLKEKQIEEAMEEAKQTERSDIGKELHDNVNQLLSASRLYLDMAKQGGVNSKMYLSRSSEFTFSAIEEIRKLTKGLTTDIIKNLGLCEAIDNICRDTMEVNQLKISCSLSRFKDATINDKFKLNAFRIVQEQLNNILKHAQATTASIGLVQTTKSIILTISDNGVGFDTSIKRNGIGIDNIKNRASSFNGTADFDSQPGRGCILKVVFPLSEMLLRIPS